MHQKQNDAMNQAIDSLINNGSIPQFDLSVVVDI